MTGPVYLRLCTNELMIVSVDWWERFLRSQDRMLGKQGKKIVDNLPIIGTSISVEDTSTENVRTIQESGREEGRSVQV